MNIDNPTDRYYSFFNAINDGVEHAKRSISFYSESGRYIVWKENGRTRWAAVGQTCYEKASYTLADTKDFEKKKDSWGGSSLIRKTTVHEIRGSINKKIIAEWEKEINEKLIDCRVREPKKPKKVKLKPIELNTNELGIIKNIVSQLKQIPEDRRDHVWRKLSKEYFWI